MKLAIGWLREVLMAKPTPSGDLKEELIRLSEELGESPSQADMRRDGNFSVSPYYREFGSWNAALEEVGLGVYNNGRLSEEELIEELQRVRNKIGRSPTVEDLNVYGVYSIGPYRSHFGSWNEAVKAAGYDPANEYMIDRQDLLDSLQTLSDDLGRTPTREDMGEVGDYNASVYQNRFGSWNAALKEGGLSINKHHGISEGDLLSELQRVADELGKTPFRREFVEIGAWGYEAYINTFGTWNKALEAAGLELNRRRNTSDEELIAEFQQLADELDETPSARQMRLFGDYDWKTYRRAFGSWNDAVEAAGFNVHEPPTGKDSPRYTPFGNSIYTTLRKFYRKEGWRVISSAARERDGHVCQIETCDREDVEVHHIIPIMSCGCNDDELLMSLCPTHHRAVEAYTKNEIVEMTLRDLALEFSDIDIGSIESTQMSIDLFG